MQSSACSERLPKGKAYVLDDEPLACELIAATVAGSTGLTAVTVAVDQSEIVRAIEESGRDDVFIVDVVLGDELDGFQVSKILAERRFAGQVVFVSAYDPAYLVLLKRLSMERGLRVAGAFEKPVAPRQLSEAIGA